MAQIGKKLKKVKFSSFGKVNIRSGNADRRLEKLYESKSNNMHCSQKVTQIDSAINNRILEIQKEEFEKEVENILILKKAKGKSSAVFHSLRNICGDKKAGQEQICMINPKTNLQIFEPKQIKEASLQYCHDLLNTRNTISFQT